MRPYNVCVCVCCRKLRRWCCSSLKQKFLLQWPRPLQSCPNSSRPTCTTPRPTHTRLPWRGETRPVQACSLATGGVCWWSSIKLCLCVSSLCVVPVTLTLSNCSSAPVDVLIDLRHKSSRYVPFVDEISGIYLYRYNFSFWELSVDWWREWSNTILAQSSTSQECE